jgi:DNA polymerase
MAAISDILRQVGYPEETLVLDFETYFDSDYLFEKLSTIEYITDKRFAFTGLGLKFNSETPIFVPGPHVARAVGRLRNRVNNLTVVIHNAKFDATVLSEKFGIYLPHVIDILDLSRYYDSRMKHDLGSLAKLFKVKAKGDTKQFAGQHWEDMDHQAMKGYCLGDVEVEYDLLEKLLPMIDNPGIELLLMQHTLDLYLKPPFRLDTKPAQEIADGMSVELDKDIEKVTSLVMKYATKKKPTPIEIIRAASIFPKILADVLPKGEQVPMKQNKPKHDKPKKMIPALAQEDIAFQLLLAHSNEQVRNLCKAKAACTSWPLHQAKVEGLIRQAACAGGNLHAPIKYYGAHTGRWSGMEGINLLNMGGKGRGKPVHPLIAKVRNAILPPEGHKFIIVDSAQIEAREVAWISGQNDLLKDFSTGGDPYSRLATKVFGERVWKPTKEEEKTPEGQTAGIRRGLGKDTDLGAGFGLGSNTLFNRCRQNETLRPLFDSGEYTWDTIDNLIKTFRSDYPRIPAFWRAIEKCFRWVTKYPNERMEYKIPGTDRVVLRFWKEGSTTIIQLPSGRRLFYRYAAVNPKDKSLKYIWGPLWGGTLTENVIQAICRDLLAGWLLECERQGIHIVLHSYDELVGCVEEDRAERALGEMKRIMTTGPDWAAGLPLDVEGEIAETYKK